MNRKEIEEKIREILRDNVLSFENLIEEDDTLLEMGLDSLDLVELEFEIERAFGFNYFENYLTSSSTLKNVVDFVYKLKNKQYENRN